MPQVASSQDPPPVSADAGWPADKGASGYAIAAGAWALGVLNLLVLHTPGPVATFVIVVIVSAWFGGTRAGVFAMALSLGAIAYFIAHLPLETGADLPRALYFLVICAFIVWVTEVQRRAARSLRDARDELQRRNQALQRENLEGKALGERLRRSENELRLVVDTIPAMAWIILPDGTLDFLNRRWLDYSGLRLEEAVGRGNSIIHPDDAPRVTTSWRRAIGEAAPFEDEMRLRRADGEYRWFLVRTVPLLGPDGLVLRWYGISTDIEDRKRAEEAARVAEQALRESAVRLQRLSQRLLQVQEEDRRHLSRELHDEFGQLLATIKLHLHAARGTAGEATRPQIEESIALLQRAGEQVRSLALELRPAILETAGLDGTLRWLARQHEQRTGVATEVSGGWGEAGGDVAIACFRVVQEALTNVARHSRAAHVWIELEQDDECRRLTVRDDGVGFDVAWAREHAPGLGHLGLLGMRERVQILGGTLEVDSVPGGGATLKVRLPAATASRPAEAA